MEGSYLFMQHCLSSHCALDDRDSCMEMADRCSSVYPIYSLELFLVDCHLFGSEIL